MMSNQLPMNRVLALIMLMRALLLRLRCLWATTASRSPSTMRCPSIGKTNLPLIYQECITVILVLLLQVVILRVLRSLRITIRLSTSLFTQKIKIAIYSYNPTFSILPMAQADSTLDRKTNFNEINCPDKLPAPEDKHFTHNDCGRISELTFEDISSYDAGYHWTQDDGTSFPYRDQGLSAVSLESLFKRFPDAHYVIELKPEENDGVGSFIQEDLNTGVEVARLINEYRMKHRVTVASFTDEIIKDFRLQDDDILTAFSEAEALPLMLAVFGGDDSYEVPAPAGEFLQIPENYSLNGLDLNLVNDSNVNFLLSAFDLRVHVWTVNDSEAMDRMLNVDNLAGIMTDFPQRLMQKIDATASSAE